MKRRQGDTRAVTQVKPHEPREKVPDADTLEYVEGQGKVTALARLLEVRRGLRARHAWQGKRQRNLGDPSEPSHRAEYAN